MINNSYKIQENNTIIGEICLWQYEGCKYPHLEFRLKKGYQNQNVKKKHLPIFLEQITNKVIVAVVKSSNLANIKLFINNKFIELDSVGGFKTFIYRK